MKWIFISIIGLISPVLCAFAPAPTGNTTHIATAPNNPSVVAAVIGRTIWVSLDGGQTWLITGALSRRRPNLPEADTTGNGASTHFLPDDPEEERPQETESDGAAETGTQSHGFFDVHLAVADNGDVVFWQRHTGQLSICPVTAACITILKDADIRDVAIDPHDTVWVAMPNHLVAYRRTRKVAIYRINNLKEILLPPRGGVMAVSANGVFEMSAEALGKFKTAVSVPGIQNAAISDRQLLICHQGQISKISKNDLLQPLMRINGCAQKLVAANDAVWVRHHGDWLRITVPLGASQTQFAPRRQPMIQVLDVAKDARGRIWLGTAAGPIRASDELTGTVKKISERYRFAPAANFQYERHTPPLPRPDAPLRSLLPRVRVWAKIGDAATATYLQRLPHAESRKKQLQVGVFFVWQTQAQPARTAQMHEQIFQREYRRRKRQQQVIAEINRHRPNACGAMHESTGPLQLRLLQLQTRRWETWRRYSHQF